MEAHTPSGRILYSVWGTSATNAYAVGFDGATSRSLILAFDGVSWEPVAGTSLADTAFHGVWGSGPDDVFAVGTAGAILHFDGSSWVLLPGPSSESLRGCWGSGPTRVFAVGEGGTAIRFDGNTWRSIPTGVLHTLNGVWGANDGHVYAVGSAGIVLVWEDGGEWRILATSIQEDLHAVGGSSSTDMYAIGESGSILHSNGAAWTRMSSPTGRTLDGLWVPPDDLPLAVGARGTILKLW
jgi:photosystem II stability/assembly factor-like uncharacterized protein